MEERAGEGSWGGEVEGEGFDPTEGEKGVDPGWYGRFL